METTILVGVKWVELSELERRLLSETTRLLIGENKVHGISRYVEKNSALKYCNLA